MALTGLFWLAIALSGILLSLKRTGGKQGHVQLKQPSQNGTSSNITVSQVSPLHYHQGVVRISRPNSNSRCFQCLSPAHDLNVCSPCLTSGAAAEQSRAMRLCVSLEYGSPVQISPPGTYYQHRDHEAGTPVRFH